MDILREKQKYLSLNLAHSNNLLIFAVLNSTCNYNIADRYGFRTKTTSVKMP